MPAQKSVSDKSRRKFLSIIVAGIGSLLLPDWSFARRYWPVRTVEKPTPSFDPKTWQLTVDGHVSNKLVLNFEKLKNLPAIKQTSDLDCVETWSVRKIKWQGIQLKTIVEMVKPNRKAKFLTIHCTGGVYSESLTMDQALKPDVILAYGADGKPLKLNHGAPVRLVVPGLWGYKSAKWVERIELVNERHLGYWVNRGYGVDSGPLKKRQKNK